MDRWEDMSEFRDHDGFNGVKIVTMDDISNHLFGGKCGYKAHFDKPSNRNVYKVEKKFDQADEDRRAMKIKKYFDSFLITFKIAIASYQVILQVCIKFYW